MKRWTAKNWLYIAEMPYNRALGGKFLPFLKPSEEKMANSIIFIDDRVQDKQALFSTQRSAAFTANSLTQVVNGIYKHAGLDGASSHSGRRGFLTNLAEKGVSVRVMMALAGHRNMATTQRYIDLRPGVLRNAVELV